MKKARKLFAIVIALIAGPLLVCQGGREFVNSRKLASEGKVTKAGVADAERYIGRRGQVSYYLKIEYEIEKGQFCRQRVNVDSAAYSSALAAGTIKVHYLPSDPSVCQAGEQVETKFGTLLMGLLALGGGLFLIVFFKQPANQEEMAESIVAHTKNLCQTHFEYASADARKFRHLDLAFYDQGRLRLEAMGFCFLQDEENLTFRRQSKSRVLLRVLLSRDGVVTAVLYHYRPGWPLRFLGAKESKVLDLETQLSNGTFVCTSNAQAAGSLNYPPEVDACFLPAAATVDMVMQAHAKRLAACLVKNPGVQPVIVHTIEDVRRVQNELQRLKAAFRQQTGITRDELQRIAGTGQSREIVKIHAKVVLLQKQADRKAA